MSFIWNRRFRPVTVPQASEVTIPTIELPLVIEEPVVEAPVVVEEVVEEPVVAEQTE